MFRCKSRWIGLLTIFGFFGVLTSTAQAHMAVEGAGEIINGALHPLLSPAHVLVLLGLGLLLGQQVPFELRTPLRVFPPVSAIALLLTTTGRIGGIYPPVLIGIAFCIGILVGLEIKLSRLACGTLCAVAALGIGLDSAMEGDLGVALVKTLLGTWISVNVVVVYLAICASNGADKKWARTGIRVIGSWIIAISLMVLAFSLRK